MRVHLYSLFTGFPHQLLKTEMREEGPGVAAMACVPPNDLPPEAPRHELPLGAAE